MASGKPISNILRIKNPYGNIVRECKSRTTDKKKTAHQFCIDNNLPPVISSITIERLKRAGEKIAKEIEDVNSKCGMFYED